MDVYIGLDVSLASSAICVLDEKGKIVTEAQVASAPDSLVAFMRELPNGTVAIDLEAGPLSQWLYKGLTDASLETLDADTDHVFFVGMIARDRQQVIDRMGQINHEAVLIDRVAILTAPD